MRSVQPSATLESFEGVGVLKKLEMIARTCYKSEDKIMEGSAEKLIAALVQRQHYAMLEHHVFVFEITESTYCYLAGCLPVDQLKYINLTCTVIAHRTCRYLVSGSVRAFKDIYTATDNCVIGCLIESIHKYFPVLIGDFNYQSQPISAKLISSGTVYTFTAEERMLHQYETAKFIVDRGVSHEIVRHRPASYAQESTRYCNYTDGKFGNELTFIEPCFFATDSGNYRAWHTAMVLTEAAYVKLIAAGAKPQEARSVLPNSLKTELWMTANAKEWYHFFSLRCAPAAHPQMQQVAKQLQAQMLPILPREEVDCDE